MRSRPPYSNLRYVDDKVLIAETIVELQELVNEVKEQSLAKGLRMNVKKTKTMVIKQKYRGRMQNRH